MIRNSTFLSILLLWCTIGKAQNVELKQSEESGKYEYSEVIEFEGNNSDQLYSKFMDWVAKSVIPNQNKGILTSDEETHEVIILVSGAPAPKNPVRPFMHSQMGYKITVIPI